MWNEFKAEFKQAKRLRHYMLAVTFISIMLPLSAFVFFYDSMGTAMMWFMGFMLALLCIVSFVEANTQGVKDRRTVVVAKVYPLKGLTLGFMQQFPFWIITGILLIAHAIVGNGPFTTDFWNYLVNISMWQYSDIMVLFDYSWLGYLVSFCILPIVCEIGYLLGNKGNIDIDDKLGGIRKH